MEWPLIALAYGMVSLLNLIIMVILFSSVSDNLRELSVVFMHTSWTSNSTQVLTGFITEASYKKLSALEDVCIHTQLQEVPLIALIIICFALTTCFCARQFRNFNYNKIEDSYTDDAVKEFALDELLFWSIFIIQITINAQLIQQPTTINDVLLSTVTLTVAIRGLTSVNRSTADGSINLIGIMLLLLIFTGIHFGSYHLTSRTDMWIFITNALLLTGLLVAHVTDGEDTSMPTVLHGKLSYVSINSCLINFWFWFIYSNRLTFGDTTFQQPDA
jgi:hypothetical protein